MSDASAVPSPVGATYVEPSAESILQPGTKIGDLFRRNMTQPYVLQRLSQRAYWVQAFNYGTVFYVGEHGVQIFDTLEGSTTTSPGPSRRSPTSRSSPPSIRITTPTTSAT